jgi:hypothetical protein
MTNILFIRNLTSLRDLIPALAKTHGLKLLFQKPSIN